MAICRIMDTGATPEQHEAMRAALGVGDEPPPGRPSTSFCVAATAPFESSTFGLNRRPPTSS